MNGEGKWGLAPAYDLSYAYNPTNKWLARHQLAINGKREGITCADLINVAKQMNIKKAKEIIEKVISVVANWKMYAMEAGIPHKQTNAIGPMHLLDL